MWYEKSFRRNLVDMHIDDWDPEFLSQFSADGYYANLVRAKIQSPMIYLHAHTGHCYFPTKTGHTHAALKGNEDMIKRLVDKCRAGGMDVVGYYSLIYNTYEEDKHPEWKMHDGGGLSPRDKGGRYGLCCPNNAGYRAFVFAQIREIADFFTLDGIFYDMLFWPVVCRCDACKARFRNETGNEIPAELNWSDETWLMFVNKRGEWMGEFAATVTKFTNEVMPGVTVEHNYASGVSGEWQNGASERVNDACDYTGGDLYGDLYNHSFTCKYYMDITKNKPFEYMTCRCDSSLNQHTVTKTEQALALEVMLTCAHHGASLVIDAIDPRGTMDGRVYERIGRVFKKHMGYEPYLMGERVAEAGVYYSTASRYNREGQPFTNKECALNTVRTMIENHVPVGVVSNGCLGRLPGYKFVFAPYLYNLSGEAEDKLIDYVKNGGNLYFSGAGSEKLLGVLLGARYTGRMTKENFTYIAPVNKTNKLFGEFTRDYSMPFTYALPIVEAPKKGVLATITLPYTARSEKKFASIHSDPPGITTDHPALIIKKFGKGSVVWCAAPAELDTRVHYKDFIMALLSKIVSPINFTIVSDAPRNIELITFKTEDGYLLSAVDLLYEEQQFPGQSFMVWYPKIRPVCSVVLLPDKTPVDFVYSDGSMTFDIDDFRMFAMYKINF